MLRAVKPEPNARKPKPVLRNDNVCPKLLLCLAQDRSSDGILQWTTGMNQCNLVIKALYPQTHRHERWNDEEIMKTAIAATIAGREISLSNLDDLQKVLAQSLIS